MSHHKHRRPRGRPPAASEKEIMGFTLDSDLKPFIEQQAIREGFIHQRSGKGNVSAWLNHQLRTMQSQVAGASPVRRPERQLGPAE